MLENKIVEFNLDGKIIPGMISSENEEGITISYANSNFSVDAPYLFKTLYKNGFEKEEVIRITQFLDPSLTTLKMEELVQKYLDKDQMEDLLYDFYASGLVTSYKFKILAMNRIIDFSLENRIFIIDLDSYNFEDELDFIFEHNCLNQNFRNK